MGAKKTDTWSAAEVLKRLKELGSEDNRAGMARFGIDIDNAFGVPLSVLRPFAREIGKSPKLAKDLWASGCHEARLVAILITPPKDLTDDQAIAWIEDIQSWDLCDQLTNVLARREGSASLIEGLAGDDREFVRRAGFALIAWRVVHAKTSPDDEFLGYFDLIRQTATDDRNFVWKAVHWALRQIGKRSATLHGPALALGEELAASGDKTARKIGRETVKELSSDKVRVRLGLT
ncbi:DNA alkylation repair protein [Roseibium sp. MMSF_3544]|uniref:DNA alkylation repair protein n=1 Tax=unclassified Roseibium TaxID=2629323 RepID=UPI00273D0B13|nr:DNA alkylation repair protein [Roseibium sp. MMSF_3544]